MPTYWVHKRVDGPVKVYGDDPAHAVRANVSKILRDAPRSVEIRQVVDTTTASKSGSNPYPIEVAGVGIGHGGGEKAFIVSMAEEERRVGRPEIGPRVTARMGADLIERVDAWAAEQEIERAEALRRLVDAGLDSQAPTASR